MKKEKEPKYSSYSFIRAFLIVAIVFTIIFTICFCFYIAKIHSCPNAGEKLLATAAVDSVSVVITVWAALNIVNAVSHRDVEEAVDKAKKLDEKLEKFNNENRIVQTDLFYIELERQNDPIVHYLRKRFEELGSGDEAEEIPFFKLTVIELKFEQVKALHKSVYQVDDELLRIAKNGEDLIRDLREKKEKKEKKEKLKKAKVDEQELSPVEAYLLYREAGFLFYRGYCTKSPSEGAEKFRLAAQKYEEFEGQLSKGNTKDNRLTAHLNNTIGEAYSKILHYYDNEKREGKDPLEAFFSGLDCRDEESVKVWMKECAEKAIDKCEKATEEGKRDPNLSTFYRNYGCALERKKRYEGKWFDEPDEVIRFYEKSIAALADDPTVPNDSVKNAYYVYLAYIGRCLQVRFTGKEQKEFKPSELVRITVRPEDVDDKLKKNVRRMYWTAKLAETEFPRSKKILVLYGFACCFALMLNDILPIVPGLPEETEFYLDEIRQCMARYTTILNAGEKESTLFHQGEDDQTDMEKIKAVLAHYEGQQSCKKIHADVHIQTQSGPLQTSCFWKHLMK